MTDRFKGMGLDSNGYVTTIGSACQSQPEFEPLVEVATRLILERSGDELHSLYLYGSVARGDAVKGKSDFDMIALLQSEPDTANSLQDLKARIFAAAGDLVTKVDLDLVTVAEVVAPEARYGWGLRQAPCGAS